MANASCLWPSLEEVKVIDKYTVQFVNAIPDPTLEGRLTRMGCDVISKRHYEEANDWQVWAAAPVGTGLDDSALSVVQDHDYKYVHFTNAAPLFFDLKTDPAQLNNLANDPAQQHTMLRYAQKMLSWRMRYMDRTLTGYAASPEGLLKRA
ncbi:hypothetical protein H0A65_06680 [Alcaligenaceae bacterium]|nr:hypothetical protein [Alcaligenaceae bacterium]